MNRADKLPKRVIRIACAAALGLSLSACSAIYRNHGYVPPAEDLAKVSVGVDTRDSVIETIGAPSSSGVLQDSGFYYVQTRFRHYGPRAPEIVSRELVAISFNPSGTVRNIERFGLEQGRVVTLQRRVTESSLEDKTFLRQLLGNLGNFNPASALPSSE